MYSKYEFNRRIGGIEMSDSQSRYSIIDELTQKKNKLLADSQNIDKNYTQEVAEYERIVEDTNRKLERMKEDLDRKSKTNEDIKKSMTEQIANFDDAIKAIKNISKTEATGE